MRDPRLTHERIAREWEQARRAFRPEVMKRFFLVRAEAGDYTGLPPGFSGAAKRRLAAMANSTSSETSRPRGDRFSNYQVLRMLLLQWLRGEGPTTALELTQETGYSYPTVAKALKPLGQYIRRRSDRRIELARFPSDEWSRLVAVADTVRESTRFVDRSGSPRSVELLQKKLSTLKRSDVAIGGVYGAKFHNPGFDLVGSPRLDITQSRSRGGADLAFVKELDPALELTEDSSVPATLVVHVDRSPNPQFAVATSGRIYADPIECLLDLHEARLEVQAAEFLDAMIRKRAKANG